jgi:uncharacterized protein (DUF433 family)
MSTTCVRTNPVRRRRYLRLFDRRRGATGRGYTMASRGFGESMTPRELVAELAALSKAEKAEVVERLAQEISDTWAGIEKTPGVAGGAACIVRTRIPVWVLEGYRRLGWTEAKILASYPTLRAADLVHAWAYAEVHREEIEEAIRQNEAA